MAPPPLLSPTRRRKDSSDSSPEFAFWNFGPHPSPPFLHSADQLFSGGFLLPLHLIPPPTPTPTSHPEPQPDPEPQPQPQPEPSPSMVTSSILTASKRWKEMIFKRVEKKHDHGDQDEKSTDKIKREKRGLNNNKSAELNININIWPFTRSRSAGNNTVRSRPAGSTGRKVSSAPCSRSNSSGSRRSVPNSPGRTGVHLGRASPVWKIRRNRTGPGSDEAAQRGKGRVMNLSVPICIGYRHQLSCRVDDNVAVGGGGGGAAGGGGGCGEGSSGDSGGNGNLFSLRGLFSKKGVLTS